MSSIRRVVVPALAVGSMVLMLACPASAATVNVSIVDSAYDPATVTITVGDTVTWTDNGSEHSVTADGGSFDSSPNCPPTCMGNGDTFSHTFTTTGSFPYHCRIHGQAMAGTVIVQAATTTTASTSSSTSSTASTSTSSTVLVGGIGAVQTTVVGVNTSPRFTG